MAISQPLLSLLGDNPTFFTAHDSSPTTIVTFAILVLVAPALVASAIVLGGHAVSPTLGARLHLGFVAVFLFVFVLQIVDLLPGPAVLAVVAAAAVTGGLHVLYTTYEPVRTVVSLVAVLPLAVVGLFVFSSPTNALIFPGDVTAVSLEGSVDADLRIPFALRFIDGMELTEVAAARAKEFELKAKAAANEERKAASLEITRLKAELAELRKRLKEMGQ